MSDPGELYPFQETGASWLATTRTACLADDMGLGKTVQAIVAADRIGAKNLLIVCPAIARQMWRNICCNPPFADSVAVVKHALEVVPHGGQVAVIAPVKWLSSQGRHAMFASDQTEQVIMLSRRPSMPPGEILIEQGESCRHSGSIDFAWVVWRKGRGNAPTMITWVK